MSRGLKRIFLIYILITLCGFQAHAQDSSLILNNDNHQLESGNYIYNELVLEENSKLNINKSVNITAKEVFIGENSEISGSGMGYKCASGPGAGGSGRGWWGGGGGGYGGAGGYGKASDQEPDYFDAPGGSSYFKNDKNIQMGSGGHFGQNEDCPDGGAGGAALSINSSKIRMLGKIDVSGEDGTTTAAAAGGGSGGGVVIVSNNLTINNGEILASGGDGSDDLTGERGGAGGGGGGVIKIFYNTLEEYNEKYDVSGGTGGTGGSHGDGENGDTGILYFEKTDEIETIGDIKKDFCNYRSNFNECIMNETNQLSSQQYNISSILKARRNAVFKAFNGPATINIDNSTQISGIWKGAINIETRSPRLKAGAEFRPQGERIIIGS